MTERQAPDRLYQLQEHQAFLRDVSDALRSLTDTTLIKGTAARMLGEHIGAARVAYFDVQETDYVVEADYTLGVASMAGRYNQTSFSSRLLEDYRAGRTVVQTDVAAWPGLTDTERTSFAGAGIAAFVSVPLVKDGEFVAGLAVHQDHARAWSDEAIHAIQEVAERTWAVVERARAEHSLHISSSRYAALFNAIDEGFCVCELIVDEQGTPVDYKFLEVNPLFEQMTGLKDAVGRGAYEMLPGLEPSWLHTYARSALGGERFRFEMGSEAMGRWFDVFSTPVAPQGHFALVFKEISDRRRAEAELRESEAFNRSLMDASPDCVKVLDTNGHMLLMNPPGLCAMEIDDFSTVKGKAWPNLWPQDSHPVVRDAVVRAQTGQETEFLAFCPTAKGTPKWWEVRVRPVRDGGDGPVVRILSISRDITEQRAAEQAMVEADRRKDEFLATLAHELRNPLAPLRSGLDVLLHAPDDPSEVKLVGEMMQRQVEQMVHLVDDLLDLSRISRGAIDLRLADIDVHAPLQQAIEASSPLLRGKGHRLVLQLNAAPLLVKVDATRLSQVFGNLLDNAAKYTDDGGTVTIETSASDQVAVITLTDTGIGIAPEKMSHVFDMFSQVDRTSTRTRGGLGIGLHIVKRLVEMHHGTITAHSDGLGRGSRFSIQLPLCQPETGKDQPSPPAAAKASPLRILLADDNRDAATMLALLLRRAGHTVKAVNSGVDALTEGTTLRPDAVILDIGMPQMDGYETCRRMRETDWGRDAHIIALTGWGQDEDRERSLASGFDQHLVKPVDPVVLSGLLARAREPRP